MPLEDHWYIACRSSDLRGAPLPVQIFHRPLDRRILERLDFQPAYAAGDVPLAALANVVDSLPVW